MYANEYKICGILSETSQGMDDTYVVVGIGINVNNRNKPNLKTLLQSNIAIPRTPILISCLKYIRSFVKMFDSGDYSLLLSKYYEKWIHYKSYIDCIDINNGIRKLQIVGLTENAYVLCETETGRLFELFPDSNCEFSLSNMIAHPLLSVC